MQILTPGSPKGLFERFVKLLRNQCFKRVLIFCSSWSPQGSKTNVLPKKFQHFSRDHRSAPGAQMDRQESALEFRTRSNTIKQGGSQGRPSNHSIKQRFQLSRIARGRPSASQKVIPRHFWYPLSYLWMSMDAKMSSLGGLGPQNWRLMVDFQRKHWNPVVKMNGQKKTP